MQNILFLKFLKESTSENNITLAEVIFALFIIDHNTPIVSTENEWPLFCISFAKKLCLQKQLL